MTTDVEKTRGIKELLRLETYQGMTDEEIETILQYKIEVERRRAFTNALMVAEMEASNLMLEDHRARYEHSQNVLESMLGVGNNDGGEL